MFKILTLYIDIKFFPFSAWAAVNRSISFMFMRHPFSHFVSAYNVMTEVKEEIKSKYRDQIAFM